MSMLSYLFQQVRPLITSRAVANRGLKDNSLFALRGLQTQTVKRNFSSPGPWTGVPGRRPGSPAPQSSPKISKESTAESQIPNSKPIHPTRLSLTPPSNAVELAANRAVIERDILSFYAKGEETMSMSKYVFSSSTAVVSIGFFGDMVPCMFLGCVGLIATILIITDARRQCMVDFRAAKATISQLDLWSTKPSIEMLRDYTVPTVGGAGTGGADNYAAYVMSTAGESLEAHRHYQYLADVCKLYAKTDARFQWIGDHATNQMNSLKSCQD